MRDNHKRAFTARQIVRRSPPSSEPSTHAQRRPAHRTRRHGAREHGEQGERAQLARALAAGSPTALRARLHQLAGASLPAAERRLASLAIGAARLTAEQLAASNSVTAELAVNHVQNKGVVLAITPGQGSARRQWIVVTEEQATGTGPYAGLPPTLHVTLAHTERLGRGWVISSWTPRT